MSKILAQHGAAKGQKINEGIAKDGLSGVIFSLNDESFESIEKYLQLHSTLTKGRVFLDPQLYYSLYDSKNQKKLSDIEEFPENVTRRDWRTKNSNLLDFLDKHQERTNLISDTLITPGFHISYIDWRFDYSLEIYNYCCNEYSFSRYALSLLVDVSFFKNKKNVEEMISDIYDMTYIKDHVYLTFCHDESTELNYEEIDPDCLSNMLLFVHKLKKMKFEVIIGYSFMNSILFWMLDCEYVATGWFNTQRKFLKGRFDVNESFGRRKKRYTSLPLLSNLMLDDINYILEFGEIDKTILCSGTRFDELFLTDQDKLSFVDLEHQYWESLDIIRKEIEVVDGVEKKVIFIRDRIKDSIVLYNTIISNLEDSEQKEASARIKTASKHLKSWLLAIDKFIEMEFMLLVGQDFD